MSAEYDWSTMSCEQVQNIWASEPEVIAIFDLRSEEEFNKTHIPGSKHLILSGLRKEVVALDDKLAVLICPDPLKKTASEVLFGKTNFVFMDDCDKWLESLSMVSGDCVKTHKGSGPCINIVNGIPEVHVDEVYRTLTSVRLIDVRREDEFSGELGHIDGAELISLGDELTKFLKSSVKKEEEVIFICRSGKRSETATKEALQAGFQRPANMVGGMLLWNEKKYPAVKSDVNLKKRKENA